MNSKINWEIKKWILFFILIVIVSKNKVEMSVYILKFKLLKLFFMIMFNNKKDKSEWDSIINDYLYLFILLLLFIINEIIYYLLLYFIIIFFFVTFLQLFMNLIKLIQYYLYLFLFLEKMILLNLHLLKLLYYYLIFFENYLNYLIMKLIHLIYFLLNYIDI